jgi:hypothetical protein
VIPYYSYRGRPSDYRLTVRHPPKPTPTAFRLSVP